MDDAFKKLEKDGKNDVDNLVQWMKDSKVIDSSKEQEDKARDLFKDVPDPKKVPLDKFKEIVTKLATELKKNFDEINKMLGEGGAGKLMQAAMGASSKVLGLGKN